MSKYKWPLPSSPLPWLKAKANSWFDDANKEPTIYSNSYADLFYARFWSNNGPRCADLLQDILEYKTENKEIIEFQNNITKLFNRMEKDIGKG